MEGSFGAPQHAPKITNHDRWIAWSEWTAEEIATRQRVLGGVWSSAINQTTGTEKRIKLGQVDAVPLEDMPEHIKQFTRRLRVYKKDRTIAEDATLEDDKKVHLVNWIQGTQDGRWKVLPCPFFEHEDGKSILVPLVEGDKVLKVSTMIVEGSAERAAVNAIKSFVVVG